MTKLQSILEDAKTLSPEDQARLVRRLIEALPLDGDDDLTVAQRGLVTWTEPARDEDWSAYYPESLRHSLHLD